MKKTFSLIILLYFSFVSLASAIEFENLSFSNDSIHIQVPKSWYRLTRSDLNKASNITKDMVKDQELLSVLNKHYISMRSSQYNMKARFRLQEGELYNRRNDILKMTFSEKFKKDLINLIEGNIPFPTYDWHFSKVNYPAIGIHILYSMVMRNEERVTELYEFPDDKGKRTILLELSYKKPEEKTVKPILNKIISSLRF
ncbi:hypothetical protein BKG92_06135 [Rodentibacter ratti]|uniref:Uncharacterized protein n=1 Tax=Rodentibacter ratti TaxID=1906745 RepID=A0A1V3KYL3_9PAST|nr:hypothetical protein [Rodentibacter ratti]OOF82772.1 hypothetical protein BKG92_06135 [Rodentibacter ratti]